MNRRSLWQIGTSLAIVWACLPVVSAGEWRTQEVDWQGPGSTKIRAVQRPDGGRALLREEYIPGRLTPANAALAETAIVAYVIDSPPIDGFVPWIAVKATNDTDAGPQEFDAVKKTSLDGSPLSGGFAVGLFDTGAGTHVIDKHAAVALGLSSESRLTNNTIEVSGVTGTVDLRVSQPFGLFVDGLAAINQDGSSLDTSRMVGESNVSVAVTKGIDPNLITAIGSPMAVFFTTSIRVDSPVSRTVQVDGSPRTFVAPDIRFYDHTDPGIPEYANRLPLELKPRGSSAVIWIYDLNSILENILFFEIEPAIPSIIAGTNQQSLFFVHSVDMSEGNYELIDRERFMIDTGAQVTVISSRVAARLRLDLKNPEFLVDIQGLSGDVKQFPGFTIDTLDMPALGEWLSFTNVPVVVLDVPSPEGGTLDGIIGMNLLVEYNLVLRGGGFVNENDPYLTFERIQTSELADIAPEGGDGLVNTLDLMGLSDAWLSLLGQSEWNPRADFAPLASPDGKIDYRDFAFFERVWMEEAD